MKTLVHAEVLKLRSTRTTPWLLLATFAMTALTVAVTVPEAGAAGPLTLDDPRLLANVVGNGFGVPEVVIVLLGGLAFTQEFRYGTVTSTYLGEPRRSRILVAKMLSLAAASVALSIATLALSVTFAIALIRSRDGDVTAGALFWEMVAAMFVVMLAYGVIGVALGALVRNQIVAFVAVLVWTLAVEQIVVHSYPVVGRWMPGGAAYALPQLAPVNGLEGELLSAPAAGLLLAAYTAAAITLAAFLTPKRDIL